MWASPRRHVADHSSDVRVAMPSHLHSTKSASLAGCSKLAPAMVPRPLWLPELYLQIERKKRADERTRTADLTSLRVSSQALQRVARVCKSPLSKRFSLLRIAACCTALRSRWYQSGVKLLTPVFPLHP